MLINVAWNSILVFLSYQQKLNSHISRRAIWSYPNISSIHRHETMTSFWAFLVFWQIILQFLIKIFFKRLFLTELYQLYEGKCIPWMCRSESSSNEREANICKWNLIKISSERQKSSLILSFIFLIWVSHIIKSGFIKLSHSQQVHFIVSCRKCQNLRTCEKL